MSNILEDNVVYYTIVKRKGLDFLKSKNSNERLETLQSRYVLDSMLNYFNLTKGVICKTALGKPYFKSKNVFFNYSHSNNFIACAISKCDVGIDIEETDRIINETMIKICDFDKDSALEELVKREAFCKMTGDGIASFFDENNFIDVDNISKTIHTKDYICSVYSNCISPIFKFININKNYI